MWEGRACVKGTGAGKAAALGELQNIQYRESVRRLPVWQRERQQMCSMWAAKEVGVYSGGVGKPRVGLKQ